MFVARGFAGATITAIAGRAGVSPPTVYAAFGGKGAIMTALLSQLEDDADAAAWRARIGAEPDPHRKLAAFAQWSRSLFGTNRAVLTAALLAAADPAVAQLHGQGDRNRRQWLVELVSALAEAGALRPGLDRRHAVDRAWLVTGADVYLRCTDGCGWSDDAYERWLTRLLHEQLLG